MISCFAPLISPSETEVDIHFLNSTSRTGIEAEITLVLTEGATVSGFEVDIDHELVQGVVVEREQAQVAFENAVRSSVAGRIAICEHVTGNVYRVRVYPVPKTGRRIRLRFVSLIDNGVCHVPLWFSTPIDTFSCHVITHATTDLKIIAPDISARDSNFKLIGTQAVTRVTNIRLTRGLELQFEPRDGAAVTRAIKPQRASDLIDSSDSSYFDTCHYFIARCHVPQVNEPSEARVHDSKTIGLFWDASRSRAADKSIEFRLVIIS